MCANCRTLIDIYLIGGGLFLLCMFGHLLCGAWGADWLLIARLTWAFICFAAITSVVITVAASTNRRARDITQISLAVFLMSLVTIFIYFATYQELLYDAEVQLTYIVVATWAILGIGLLCLEKRFVKKLSLADAKPQPHWAIPLICRPIAVLITVGVLVMAIDIGMGNQTMFGFWRLPWRVFSSAHANTVTQWTLVVLCMNGAFFCWQAMSLNHRERLYPANTHADLPQIFSLTWNTTQAICIFLFLLTLAVQGEHFYLTIEGAFFHAFSFWAYLKVSTISQQKRDEKMAAGTIYIR